MILRREDLAALEAHARTGHPHEVCGVLLGTAETVSRVAAVPNREQERPGVRFAIDPADLLRLEQEASAAGMTIIGYYHSHPDHPARPSETDRQRAAEGLSDGVFHLVVAVAGGARTETTAWVFRAETAAFEPVPLTVVEASKVPGVV